MPELKFFLGISQWPATPCKEVLICNFHFGYEELHLRDIYAIQLLTFPSTNFDINERMTYSYYLSKVIYVNP